MTPRPLAREPIAGDGDTHRLDPMRWDARDPGLVDHPSRVAHLPHVDLTVIVASPHAETSTIVIAAAVAQTRHGDRRAERLGANGGVPAVVEDDLGAHRPEPTGPFVQIEMQRGIDDVQIR